ncbi:MAG TPA: NADH-quinone oxidoreductase subunit C [Actinomycetota bacterium]|nr:NADH-quinone oxidoreductase subunit C [Actinomycetota bacterium]
MSPDDLTAALRRRFDDVLVSRGEVTVTVNRERLVDVLRSLRDDDELRFTFLADVSCTDWPGRDPRIWMAYHLYSPDRNHRVRLKVGLPEEDLRVASATAVFDAANWHEREVYDFFGVTFDGHPDLRRIMMPDEWVGHPLRKDEPLGGVPTQYKGAYVPPPDERGL